MRPEVTPDSDGRVVARAAAVNALGMVAKSSRVLATVFITRVSGPAVFGLFMLAASVAELTSRFTIFGMDKSVLKYVPERRSDGSGVEYAVLSTVMYAGAFLATLATVVLLVVAPWVAGDRLDAPELVTPVRIVAFAVLPLTLATLLLAATKALKIMRYDALVTGLAMPLAMLVLAIPIIWTADDVRTLTFAYLFSTVVALVMAGRFFGKHFSTTTLLSTRPGRTAREVLRFSTPLGLHDFVQSLATKLELFLLLIFVSPTQLGIYALASELSFVMKKVRQSFDPILIPLMSEAGVLGEAERAREQVSRVIRWVLMICVPFVGVMMLVGGPVLSLFGDQFASGALALALLCLAQLLNVITGLFDLSMLVSGRPRINLLNVCILLVTQTALNLWLMPRYGIVGGAAAALGAFFVLAMVRVAQGRLILDLRPFTASQLKPLLAGGLAAAPVLLVLRTMPDAAMGHAIVAGVAYVLVYALALRSIGLAEEDLVLVRSVTRRFSRSAR